MVIFEGAHVTGEIFVDGDTYVFGKIGGEDAAQSLTNMTVTKTLYMTSKSIAYGKLRCVNLALYKGAQLHGALDMIDSTKIESN